MMGGTGNDYSRSDERMVQKIQPKQVRLTLYKQTEKLQM